MPSAIETFGLSRRFGPRLAVDDVSLTVPDQAVYGFLGRNGAGKTTTLKMLLGLIRPTAGSARIAGIDIAADRLAAARKVGALLEAHGFYANLTGRANLDLTRRLLSLPQAEIDRVLEVVELTAEAGRRVGGYSLGMRQRLGLARAMLGAPPVLILDEPCNGLDPDGIADMRDFLRTLPARTGATVLLSSHLLGEIEQTASHVGILQDGRLVLEGSLDRLKADLPAELEIDSDDPDRAAQVAAARGFTAAPVDGRLRLTLGRVDDPRQAAAALNRALVEAGLAVFALATRPPSLESLYQAAAVRPSPLPLKDAA